MRNVVSVNFFFQADDGIRDYDVTGVQTCALPILVLVARGDMVKRGDIIGRVGSTGNVATPQVHFELRRGVGSVDPVKYLAKN